MNLQPTEEQQAIIDALHDFSSNEIRPIAREAEAAGRPPERITKQLHEMGITAPVPEEFGGQGTFDAVTSVLIAEELGWGDPGIAYAVLSPGIAATVIDQFGTQSQRSELLPRLLNGEGGSFALAERDAGADFSILDTMAQDSKVTGTKYAVADADTAKIRLAVGQGPKVWLIDEKATFTIKPEDKLGLRSAPTAKVSFDNTQATELGEPGTDPSKVLLRAKLTNAGIALGLARAALEYAMHYAKERTAFGRPIGAFQAISFKIADRAMDLETARLMVWKAAWALDNDRDIAARQVMSACGHAVAAAVANADDGVQILGGHGFMQDHPEELWYRDALTLATFDSPSMIGDLAMSAAYKTQAGI